MKIRIIILILSVAVLAVVLYFGLHEGNKIDNLAPGVHQVRAKEVLQTTNYTYVHVTEGRQDYWCAINRSDIEVGKTYFWLNGSEMKDFQSKELDRTFASIFFMESLSDKPILSGPSMTGGSSMPGAASTGRQKVAEKQGISVEKAEGGITVAELYANRKSYAGKSVKIKAEVVKYSPHIMNRNWVHVQDGTRDGDSYDLVVTTHDSISVGDIGLFEGVVSLDVDFGAGYKYDVIIQDARVK
jgi:hypothetical protein